MMAGGALAERVVSSIESLALGGRCRKCPPLGVFVVLFQFRVSVLAALLISKLTSRKNG